MFLWDWSALLVQFWQAFLFLNMIGAGYVYLCCAGTNYHKEFARTYQPRSVIAVIPVADAPTLERVSHTMLAAKKVGNEVFDMSNEDGIFNRVLWDNNARIIREINETSGLALPESVEVIDERKLYPDHGGTLAHKIQAICQQGLSAP